MSLLSIDEIIDTLDPLVGSLSAEVDSDPKEEAVKQALRELHWTVPITDDAKAYWVLERSKRYVYSILLSSSAHKFRYKNIHLQQRFDNYLRLIKMMDAAFKDALENDLELFDIGTYSNLFSYVTSGFTYDHFGRER